MIDEILLGLSEPQPQAASSGHASSSFRKGYILVSEKKNTTRKPKGAKKGYLEKGLIYFHNMYKGVRESESRTGTRLVSPRRRPRKKKNDLSINISLNRISSTVVTT